ncbi:MAG: alcohol dehydrogenase [Dehalococcoidia bacterium]|nr:MAG: alcohol dehydrogenase [Dehalococcoidia bacterium]
MGRLDGKVALVTGASSGLGKAMAIAFAQEGADVALAARRIEKLEETARLCREAGARALAIPCDVTNEAQVNAMVDRALAELGRLDIVVNNAGIGPYAPGLRENPYQPLASLAETTRLEWDSIIATNLTGPFLVMKAALPIMREGGSVINITSMSARFAGSGGGGAYVASKWVLDVLTRIVAEEQRERGIRVNALCPGAVVETDFFATIRDRQFMPAMAGEDVILPAAIFLASDESRDVTGQCYYGKWFNEYVADTGAPPRQGI